ncbi:hypothetical protein LJC22_06585 [Desulfosarcina sp. OttesenSCG-928-G10]|nr:hypothetical protein [Desulfosarcina sp. OttesenSCG-928-G10]MDL2320734.1 hypothetical protein [Desulfosarcina sp. OttesenSCG-928-B08]
MADFGVPAWFQKDAYYQNKLASLGDGWTGASLDSTFLGAGYSLDAQGMYRHFVDYGNSENISPNSLFDAQTYLRNKTADFFAANGPTGEQIAEVAFLINGAGMTLWDHYCSYGWIEGINPSNAFDAHQYFSDKLALLGDGWTWDAMIQTFADSGLNPVTHYYACGAGEGLSVKAISSSGPGCNASPVIIGIPGSVQYIPPSREINLADLMVFDADNDDLMVTLAAQSGTILGITDENPDLAGIQLYGKATEINQKLDDLAFKTSQGGSTALQMTVSDGVNTTSGEYQVFSSWSYELDITRTTGIRVVTPTDLGSELETWVTRLKLRGLSVTLSDPDIIDAEKSSLFLKAYADDDNMCWAAVAANMLVSSGWAFQSDMGVKNGPKAEDAVFSEFITHFTNGDKVGGNSALGLYWFFDGSYADVDEEVFAMPAGGGNYLNISPDSYVFSIGGFDADLGDYLDEAFDLGVSVGISAGLYNSRGERVSGHAMTCWGYTCNTTVDVTDKNFLTGLVITDSDDNQKSNPETAPDTLRIITLEWDAYNAMYYTDNISGAGSSTVYYIDGVDILLPNGAMYDRELYAEITLGGSVAQEGVGLVGIAPGDEMTLDMTA